MRYYRVAIALSCLTNACLIADSVQAQVTSDGTVGTVVTGSPNFTITGGIRPSNGPNLFHSFSQFSVPTGGSAIFKNAPDVVNIISRVTGGSVSNINGAIRANGSANLFLMNPAGIIFGPRASLNIGGSFVGTTANSIKFSDGSEFSSTSPASAPLLTVSVPIGLQMGSNPGAIVNQSFVNGGRGLETLPGNSLLLVGGDLQFQRGRVHAPGGQVELAAIAGEGTVDLIPKGAAWQLGVPNELPLADVTFAKASGIYVRAQGGGDIVLRGQNVRIIEDSLLRAGIDPGASDRSIRSGDITIDAPGSFTLTDSLILNTVTSPAAVTGTSGDVNIRTGAFSLLNGGQISVGTDRLGDGGNVNVQADTVLISGTSSLRPRFSSGIFNRVFPTGIGQSGNIDIIANAIALNNGGQINANVLGQGRVGNVNLRANQITVDGIGTNSTLGSLIGNSVLAGGRGQSGDINITTDSLKLTNGGQIQVSLQSQGISGNVNVQAQDVLIEGGQKVATSGSSNFLFTSSIRALSDSNTLPIGGGFTYDKNRAIGQGGDINIATNSLVLRNGGNLESSTRADGDAGNINLNAKTILVDGSFDTIPSGPSSNVFRGGVGNGGAIQINTDTLTVSNGALISATTNGRGNAGTIAANVTTEIRIAGRSLLNPQTSSALTTSSSSVGQGGTIAISSPRLIMEDGAQINVSARSTGGAGNLSINADQVILNTGSALGSEVNAGSQGNIALFTNSLDLDNAYISSASNGSGRAGNIYITSQRTALVNGSEITTRSRRTGDGGTIYIAGKSLNLRNRSAINASTASGEGGNIDVNLSGLLYLRDFSQLNAEAGGTGNGGNINIKALFVVGWGNSDIIANAFRGKGGNIQIATQGIYGLKFRPQLTPQNDITASSQFGVNGSVQIQVLSIDPSNGLTELPVDLTDPSQQIATGCAADDGSSFVSTGRGGIPVNPTQGLRGDRTWADTRDLSAFRGSENAVSPASNASRPTPIIEANAIRRHANGTVELIAETQFGNTGISNVVSCATSDFQAKGAVSSERSEAKQ
jgi:filamentous hemagglutinin family protein